MNASRLIITILSVCFISAIAAATELARCLDSAVVQNHRLEKEDLIRYCYNKHKKNVDKKTCYLNLADKVSKFSSIKLNEEINTICFYETTSAKSMDSCLSEARKFKNSTNHDEAVFYCYQEFQDLLSKKDCLKTAEQLIYPLKKQYLQQHCLNVRD